jgi:tight adherence protein C
MLEYLQALPGAGAVSMADFGVYGVAIGVFMAFLGVIAALAPRNRVVRRMSAQTPRSRDVGFEAGLLRPVAQAPSGLMKSLIPADEKERTKVQIQLAQSGIDGPHAVRNYYLLRVVFGLVLPLLLIGIIAGAQGGLFALPEPIAQRINGLGKMQLLQAMAVLVWIGFFGPAYWLKARSSRRQEAIRLAFPNALDLLQISVEAGLGIDAAMIRVGNEVADAAPELSREFLTAQREIQAGRNRDRALLDMASRTQVEEVGSFVNVVLQSIQFGADISGVLTTYAAEMRQHRELRAQEKANKLPVQMSAVMAFLMLPALLTLTIGPVAIRYFRYFSE